MSTIGCRDVLELVEPIAGGDLEVQPAVRAHLESCPRCAAALASARRIERALASFDLPSAPPRFTAIVQARIRRERWRAEQNVDRLFNVGVGAALVLIAGGLLALLNVDSVVAAGRLAGTVLSSFTAPTVEHVGPAIATYGAAAGLLASALGMWWWADRRLSL